MEFEYTLTDAQRFNRCLITNNGNDDLTWSCSGLVANDHHIARHDSFSDHTFTANPQSEQFPRNSCVNGDVALAIFDGGSQGTGLDAAEERHKSRGRI